MSVFLIRHADKESGDYYSTSLPLNNQPLNEVGKIKSNNFVPIFLNIDITNIFVSEYIRTRQTIEAVANLKNITPIIDSRLNEINIGDTDKLTDDEIKIKYPKFWQKYLMRNVDFRFPNGESGAEAKRRIWDLFCTLDVTKNYILVAHDGIIRVLLCRIVGIPPYKRHLFKIDLASITICDYIHEFNSWSLVKVNQTL